jgi:hypothetical protein
MAIVKTVSNDTRSRATLLHSIGSVVFAWSDSESTAVICFRPVNNMPSWFISGTNLVSNTPMTFGKGKARQIWDEFVNLGWRDEQ